MAGLADPANRGHGGVRQRPALVLPALVVPAGVELAEYACPVREASELVGCTFQNLHLRIEAGSLPAFQHEGVRYVRLDDLAESRAARRQAAEMARELVRRAEHDDRVAHPFSYLPVDERCTGAYETCEICNLDLLARWDAEGTELVEVPVPAKRPVSDERRAQLSRARAIKSAGDVRRRADREQAVVRGRAQMGPTE